MLKESLEQRRAQYERRVHDLTWERVQVQNHLSEIDKAISELGGAIYEIDQVRKDLDTQAAIAAAKESQEVNTDE